MNINEDKIEWKKSVIVTIALHYIESDSDRNYELAIWILSRKLNYTTIVRSELFILFDYE